MRKAIIGFALVFSALAWADAAEDAAKLDALFLQREDSAAQKELDATLDAALKASPNDYGILWRAARNKFWLADGTSGDSKKRLGREAWELGDRAVKANPNGVEGQYFTATGIGAYSQAAGILKALTEGLEGKFNERLDASIKLDPGFYACGPLVAKGRYFYELPWPKRDLSKSMEMLNKAIAQCPVGIRSYVYLAESQLKDGQAKKAKETLAKAPTDVTYDVPEGHRALGMLKRAQVEVDKEAK